ncbi:MAG: hypothetical protein V3V78_01545 [Candidatus Woesearchaeota archaeon]
MIKTIILAILIIIPLIVVALGIYLLIKYYKTKDRKHLIWGLIAILSVAIIAFLIFVVLPRTMVVF